jgi:hypothetical protein
LTRLAYQIGTLGSWGYHPMYPASRQTVRDPAKVMKVLMIF